VPAEGRGKEGLFACGGEMGALMRMQDWSRSPLGPPEGWPQSLRAAVGLMLPSKFPMFIAWGRELGFLYNEAYAEILGTKHPEAMGARFHDVWPEVWPEIAPLIEAALAGEASYHEDFGLVMNRRGGKEEAWFTFSYSPLRDESGAVAGMFCVCQETTPKVLSERKLRVSEQRLRSLADNLPGGAVYQVSTGRDGSERKFLYLSQSYERLTGVPAEQVIADPGIAYRMTLPEYQGRVAAAEAAAIATRRQFDVETRFRRADGELRWCRIISAPREAEDGSLIWDGLEIDITAQKEAEKALKNLAARLSAALSVAELGTFEWNLATHELFLDARSRAMFGFGPGEGRRIEDLLERIAPGDRPRVYEAATTAASTGARLEIEYRIALGQGAERSIVSISEVTPAHDGTPARMTGVFGDITDRKRLEAELRSLNETLERRVEERTAELMQAQEALRQSQKLEAMGQLTGGVAHDFNNLLSPIIGGLDLLQRMRLGGEREQRLIEGAMQSAERARVLVQRLLAFARRQPLKASGVDVGALVRGMGELVASTSGPQIKVKVEVPDDLPAARADPNQLELAILNLSVNARDAMPNGGTLTISADECQVTARSGSDLKPGGYVRLRVVDTGHGMDEPTLRRAVEPFFSTKGIGKGTGLGLSMAHGLASQLGGALTLSSAPGQGTSVELWLPVSPKPLRRDEGRPEVRRHAAAGTILLVDDEPLVRASTADMLVEMGYGVIEASSAKEALQRLDDTAIEMVVSDHLMPGLTGTDLAEVIRDCWPGMPVLIISGYADLEGMPPDLARLSKPFRQADLAAALDEARERGRP